MTTFASRRATLVVGAGPRPPGRLDNSGEGGQGVGSFGTEANSPGVGPVILLGWRADLGRTAILTYQLANLEKFAIHDGAA